MTEKPPLPVGWFDAWPRIPVDDSRGTDAASIIRIAVRAADDWALGDHGPYRNPSLTLSDITQGVIEEALKHLLELGLIDIDSERLHAAHGYPTRRRDLRPDMAGDPS